LNWGEFLFYNWIWSQEEIMDNYRKYKLVSTERNFTLSPSYYTDFSDPEFINVQKNIYTMSRYAGKALVPLIVRRNDT